MKFDDVIDSAVIIRDIDALAANGDMAGLTLFRTTDGWQASLQSAKTGGYRVKRAATPSEAFAAVLGMDWVDEHDAGAGLAAPVTEPTEPLPADDASVFD